MNKGYNRCLTGFCEFSGQLQTRRFLNVPVSKIFQHTVGGKQRGIASLVSVSRRKNVLEHIEEITVIAGTPRSELLMKTIKIPAELLLLQKTPEDFFYRIEQDAFRQIKPALISQVFRYWQELIP